MSSNAPIEGKVWSSTIGSGIGLTLSTLILWILGVTVWGAPRDAASATLAVKAIPEPIVGFIGLVVTVGMTFLAGFTTKHTPRPEVTEALDEVEAAEEDSEEDLDDELGSVNDEAPDVDMQDPEATVVEPQRPV